MALDDIIDIAPKEEFNRNKKRQVYAFTIFALLDTVSFMLSFDFFLEILQIGYEFDAFILCKAILILSLLASAILFALRKKQALQIYFVQLPFKFVFSTLSFAFLLDLMGVSYKDSAFFWGVVVLFALEVFRLVYSIVIYRRF